MPQSKITSPKLTSRGEIVAKGGFFPYYAGFSEKFVRDVIEHLELPPQRVVLDPWLGSGTTGTIALSAGYRFRGFDLNPAMVVISNARMVPRDISPEVRDVVRAALSMFRSGEGRRPPVSKEDALTQWLSPRSAAILRRLENAVSEAGCLCLGGDGEPKWRRIERAAPELAIIYVALFRTLRLYLAPARTSNPTWTKIPKPSARISFDKSNLVGTFQGEVEALLNRISSSQFDVPLPKRGRCIIRRASSLRIPLASESVDAVITSPPYCTRIDYVKATMPELAIIGFPMGPRMRRLREEMIGTPTVTGATAKIDRAWGVACTTFLSRVEMHHSKASESYYLKYFCQYFDCLFRSLQELDRVLKRGAFCTLVIQDSYYKDVRNHLPKIIEEMGANLGWRLSTRVDFRVSRSMRAINSGAKRYRERCEALESAVIFEK